MKFMIRQGNSNKILRLLLSVFLLTSIVPAKALADSDTRYVREENKMKRIIVCIMILVVLTCVSCKSSAEFDRIMNTCLDANGCEFVPEGKFKEEKSGDYTLEYSSGRYKDFNILQSFDMTGPSFSLGLNEYDKKKNAQESQDTATTRLKFSDEPEVANDEGTLVYPSQFGFQLYYENDDEGGYVVEITEYLANEYVFNASYLIGKCRLHFQISICDEEGKNAYDIYLKMCNRLDLYTSDKISKLVKDTVYK